jgi:hypothetical protein
MVKGGMEVVGEKAWNHRREFLLSSWWTKSWALYGGHNQRGGSKSNANPAGRKEVVAERFVMRRKFVGKLAVKQTPGLVIPIQAFKMREILARGVVVVPVQTAKSTQTSGCVDFLKTR